MNAARDELQVECTKLKAEHLEEERKQPIRLPMSSEARLPRRIPVPLAVRWREFRIQILPWLAFGGSLALAGVLWQKAVLPLPGDANVNASSTARKVMEPDPPLSIPATAPEVSQTGSNGIPHLPAGRD